VPIQDLGTPSIWGERKALTNNDIFTITGPLAPASGLNGDGLNICGVGSRYLARDSGVWFVNEGTKTNPYWSPMNFAHPALLGAQDLCRGPSMSAIASVVASLNAASGVRVFGEGIAEVDSGVVGGTNIEGAMIQEMRTTNEDEHTVALGIGTSVAMYQPDKTGQMVIDITWSQLTDILARRVFVGFLGEVADVMIIPATGATTVITFNASGTAGDDLCGFFMDANLTDPDALSFITNKGNADASRTTVQSALDTPTNLAAAATYQRMRVEIDAKGNALGFIDKIQVVSALLAVDVDEELAPAVVLGVESGTTITKATLKQISMYSNAA